MHTASELLRYAASLIEQRAHNRDQPAERSMLRTVATFNALTGQALSEYQGWLFMAVLKLARAQSGALNPDDYLDGAAYLALALEHLLGATGEVEGVPTDSLGVVSSTSPVASEANSEPLYRGFSRVVHDWKSRE